MALMLALVYDGHDTADRAFSTVAALESAGYVTILDELVVRKDDKGAIALDKERHPVRHGAEVGAVVGGILGLIVFAPVVGAAAGAAVGGIVGKSGDAGHTQFKEFAEQVQAEIPNGGSAIVLLGETDARDRVVHDLGGLGGKLITSDISSAQVAELQKGIDAAARGGTHTVG